MCTHALGRGTLRSMMTRACLVAAVVGLLAACAPAQPPASSPGVDGHMVLRKPGQPTIAKLEGVRFFGPEGEVDRFEDGWRGRWRGEIVDLRAVGDRITGMVHGQPTDLHVVTDGDTIEIRGIFGGDLGSLRLGPNEIDGTIGRRGLHVVRKHNGTEWKGAAGSNGEPRSVSPVPLVALELPDGFEQLPLVERAVWIALLVGV